MNNTDLIKKVEDVQKKWANGLVHIGKAKHLDLGDKEIENRATTMLNELYDFTGKHILFKPTKAAEKPFRFNFEETLSYFIKGVVDEDEGFALTPWETVKFKQITESNIMEQDCDILVMGEYTFTSYGGESATVEYTFGYRGENQRIFLHHSSLPFVPEDESKSFKEAAKDEKGITGFNVILPADFDYDNAKEISNSYFNLNPAAVIFPRAVNQVSFSINEYNKKNRARSIDDKIPLRIMSGGHHHEGMSSADGAYVIRMSDLGTIDYNSAKTEAWIPTGMKLGAVYQELEQYDKTIPGGGCMNVNVGGLTHGGGWGMNSRKDGLTCDNILAAEMVLANGDIVVASEENHPSLFWAIRGGGGGNFGIVTRFLFRLQDISPEICIFRFYWKHDQMEKATATYLEEQKDFPKELTSFLRLTAMPRPKDGKYDKNYPVYASGMYHGNLDDLIRILKPLHDQTHPENPHYFVRSLKGYKDGELAAVRRFVGDGIKSILSEILPKEEAEIQNNPLSFIDFLDYDISSDFNTQFLADKKDAKHLVSPPTSNCGAPHPHKVSSAFSRSIQGESPSEYYGNIAKVVTNYFENSISGEYAENLPYVRSYMTVHSMGGAISDVQNSGSAFGFRDSEFLLQFQSWWNYSAGSNEKSRKKEANWQQVYIDWVKKLRFELEKEELVEGAFINFVDKDLVKELKTPKDKYDLLKFYYRDNLDELIKIKAKYDENNVFDFPMSIPLTTP